MRVSVEEADIHRCTAVGGLSERGKVQFADSGDLARTFQHGWRPVAVETVSRRRGPLVITIEGLLGACPAGGEVLRRDSGKLLGDGHGNPYPGGVHPLFEDPVRHKIPDRAGNCAGPRGKSVTSAPRHLQRR